MTTSAASASTQRDWRSTLGRAGLSARGVLYVGIGYLALQAAFGGGGGGGATSGGVVSYLRSLPGGTVIVGVLAAGLVAYALWQLTRAAFGDPVTGSEASDRLMYAMKGAVYGGLAFTTVASLLGSGSGSGGSGNTRAAGFLLGLPGGALITGAVGIGIAVYGLKQLKENAVDARFMRKLSPDRYANERAVRRAGQAGYGARGVTLAIIGGFFVVAALQHDPSEAQGLGGALDTLSRQAYGPYLLGLTGLGLALFGVYCFAEAKMRRDHGD